LRHAGMAAVAGFVVYTALKILVPPAEIIQTVRSPDGVRIARLKRNYYYAEPLLSVQLHLAGPFWRTVYYEPARDTNAPPVRVEVLAWDRDGHLLRLQVNQTNVWEKQFGP